MNEPAKVTFEIENFCNQTGDKERKFELPQNDQIEFQLICKPQNLTNIFGYKYTTVYLCLSSFNIDKVTVRYQISILNAKGQKCDPLEKISYGGLYQIKYDHLANPENGFLVNGKLSIYCEIEEVDPTNKNFSILNEPNPILDDYQSLLESGKFSDASLIVKIGEERLLVHKAILSARSKVFAAMFENDCEEKRQNRVEIVDIPVEVCEQMLSYIYTGKIPDMSEFAGDLFVAADKYQLEHLKDACEKYLSSMIEVETAANSLLVADMHHAPLLKIKAIDFIVDNASKVMATEGWKNLTNRSDLLVDLFQKMTIKTNR